MRKKKSFLRSLRLVVTTNVSLISSSYFLYSLSFYQVHRRFSLHSSQVIRRGNRIERTEEMSKRFNGYLFLSKKSFRSFILDVIPFPLYIHRAPHFTLDIVFDHSPFHCSLHSSISLSYVLLRHIFHATFDFFLITWVSNEKCYLFSIRSMIFQNERWTPLENLIWSKNHGVVHCSWILFKFSQWILLMKELDWTKLEWNDKF